MNTIEPTPINLRVTPMKELPEVLLIEPRVFADSRGFFLESFNRRSFQAATGLDVDFVQDNHSRSQRNVLRGLHYQLEQPQGKLVRVVVGSVFDVAVDVRAGSPTLGAWVGMELSAENHLQAWIPPGFAHGFLVTSDVAEMVYKATDYYLPSSERSLLWNDPEIGISWPLGTDPPTLSEKDIAGSPLATADLFTESSPPPTELG